MRGITSLKVAAPRYSGVLHLNTDGLCVEKVAQGHLRVNIRVESEGMDRPRTPRLGSFFAAMAGLFSGYVRLHILKRISRHRVPPIEGPKSIGGIVHSKLRYNHLVRQ